MQNYRKKKIWHVIEVPDEERVGGAEKILQEKGPTISKIWQNEITDSKGWVNTKLGKPKEIHTKAQNSQPEN